MHRRHSSQRSDAKSRRRISDQPSRPPLQHATSLCAPRSSDVGHGAGSGRSRQSPPPQRPARHASGHAVRIIVPTCEQPPSAVQPSKARFRPELATLAALSRRFLRVTLCPLWLNAFCRSLIEPCLGESTPPSPSPIAPSAQQRSSSAPPPRASSRHSLTSEPFDSPA